MTNEKNSTKITFMTIIWIYDTIYDTNNSHDVFKMKYGWKKCENSFKIICGILIICNL